MINTIIKLPNNAIQDFLQDFLQAQDFSALNELSYFIIYKC